MKIDWALLRFPFDDPRWKGKLAVGGLLVLVASFVSVPLFWLVLPVQGFALRIMRRTARGEPPALPEWQGWGELFIDGLKLWVIGFVYLLPVTLIACGVYALWIAFIVGTPLIAGRSGNLPPEAAGGFFAGIVGLYAASFCLIGIILLLAILLGFLAAVAMSRFAATDSLGSAFQFREVWNLARQGFKNYVLAAIVLLGTAYAVTFPTVILAYTIVLACLYPFALALASIYLQTIFSAVVGMAYYHTANPSAAAVARDVPAPRPPAGEPSTLPAVTSAVERTPTPGPTPPPRSRLPDKKPGDADATTAARRPPKKQPPAES